MTLLVKHSFTSAKADGPDPTLIQPSNWNAGHTLTQATGYLLGRTSAGAGNTEEVSPAAAQTLLGLQSAAYVTASSLATNVQIAAATDAAFVDADYVTALQSSGGALIKRSWANTKSAILTAFGPLITALTAKSTLKLTDQFLLADNDAAGASKSGTLSALATLMATQIQPPQGYLSGLTATNNSTNALDIAVGTAVDSTGLQGMTLSAALTNKSLSANWVAGINQGMLDTGAVADGTYHIYLIKNLTSGVVDVIASLSASAPTLPTGFTVYRRILSIVRAAGAIRPFIQDGDRFYWNTASPVQNVNSSAAVTKAAVSVTIPTGIRVEGIFEVELDFNATLNLQSAFLYDGNNSNIVKELAGTGNYYGTTLKGVLSQYSDAAGHIIFASSVTGGSFGSVFMWTLGYIDTRGR